MAIIGRRIRAEKEPPRQTKVSMTETSLKIIEYCTIVIV